MILRSNLSVLLAILISCKSLQLSYNRLSNCVSRVHSSHLSMQNIDVDAILAIDIGSTCIKCAAYSGSHPVREIPDATAEICNTEHFVDNHFDPDEIFNTVNEVVDRTVKILRDMNVKIVRGVGFTSLVMNIFGVNEEGNPITPCFIYSSPRPAGGVEGVFQDMVQADYRRTGAVVHPAYATVQLRAYADSVEGEAVLDSVYRWQSLVSHIIAKWTGQTQCPISYTEASWTGLLDFKRGIWDEKATAVARIRKDQLPDLRDSISDPILDGLSQQFLGRWPELSRVPLFLGIGDGVAATVGSLCDRPSRITVSIGTSCAARVLVDLPLNRGDSDSSDVRRTLPPEGLWCYRVDTQRVIVGGAMTDGGAALAWLANLVGEEHMADARSKVAKIVGDMDVAVISQFPITLPYWSGERSPGWHGSAAGTITGLTRSSDSASLLYTVQEGVAMGLNAIIERMRSAGLVSDCSEGCIVGSGKGMGRDPVWRQIIADVTGYPVVRLRLSGQATPRGVAVMMLCALDPDNVPPATEGGLWGFAPQEVESVTWPRLGMKALYEQRRAKQQILYDAVMVLYETGGLGEGLSAQSPDKEALLTTI